MLKSKNFFVALLVALAMLTTMANATVSRLEGLGGSGDSYWWDLPGNIFVLHDAATPGIWPQLIQQYPNLAGGEFGYGDDGWDLNKVYVNYTWGERKSTLQFALDKGYSTRFFNTAFDPNPGVPSRLSLTYGRKLGDALLLGVGLSYMGQSYEQKDDPATDPPNEAAKYSASVIGLKVGLSGVGDYEWDAVLGFELPGFTNEEAGTTVSENDGSMGIHFAGRWWWNYYEKCSLIPNVRFMNIKDAATYAGSPTPGASITSTQIAVGVGHNWWPVENALVLFDIGVKLETVKYEYTPSTGADFDSKTNALPYWRAGFETTIFSWLDGRLGAERDWRIFEQTGDARPTEPKWSTSETSTFLGATAHWNRMILDLVMYPDFLSNGPYFISGESSSMFSRVSLKYDFNQ